jgi:hypothetical protein
MAGALVRWSTSNRVSKPTYRLLFSGCSESGTSMNNIRLPGTDSQNNRAHWSAGSRVSKPARGPLSSG